MLCNKLIIYKHFTLLCCGRVKFFIAAEIAKLDQSLTNLLEAIWKRSESQGSPSLRVGFLLSWEFFETLSSFLTEVKQEWMGHQFATVQAE
jgi:hypothetical protein